MDANLSDARDSRLSSYLLIFALAFLYYDHLITIDREIKFVWMRPMKPSTYWFLANRYFLFLANITMALFEFMPFKPSESCVGYGLLRQVFTALNQFLVSVLMTLRVYALYGRSPRVLGGLAIIEAIIFSITCWALFAGQKTTVGQQTLGCRVGFSYNTSKRLATAWETSFAYDSIIFTLTFIRTWGAGRHIEIRSRRPPLTTLLLRDGAIYFAVMALSNLANILTFYFCGPFLRGGLSAFSTCISVTMMSRLMLNLHETANVGLFSTHVDTLGCSLEFVANSELSEQTVEGTPGRQSPQAQNDTENSTADSWFSLP